MGQSLPPQGAPLQIFEALRLSHALQRDLCARLLQPETEPALRDALQQRLRTELVAHALAEDRHFYVPLMAHNAGMDLSRHAIAEHHQIDELLEALDAAPPGTDRWRSVAEQLAHKVEHHLQEEEHRFFQQAGKLLDAAQKTALALAYLQAYDDAKAGMQAPHGG